MSRFYGTIHGAAKNDQSMRGHKETGLTTIAASYFGAVKVELETDEDGDDTFKISMIPWKGSRTQRTTLCEGKFKDHPHII